MVTTSLLAGPWCPADDAVTLLAVVLPAVLLLPGLLLAVALLAVALQEVAPAIRAPTAITPAPRRARSRQPVPLPNICVLRSLDL